MDVINETRRGRELKDNALYRTLWTTRFGRDYGPVVRQTTLMVIYFKLKFDHVRFYCCNYTCFFHLQSELVATPCCMWICLTWSVVCRG